MNIESAAHGSESHVGKRRQPRSLAFYLPQFHPIPENDAWWGNGFTEWTNVTKARPRFRGHYQPHFPADLGYYDLRVPETRQAQANLARAHGVDGFVYYHYWFGGKQVLEGVLDSVLATGAPDFPFCVCWANENWTRRWDGGNSEILLGQRYSDRDDIDHMTLLCTFMADPRYIRIDGRPLLIVYHADQLPDASKTAGNWRRVASESGLGELCLAAVESFGAPKEDPRGFGFDVAIDFQPDFANAWHVGKMRNWWHRAEFRLGRPPAVREDYATVVQRMLDRPVPAYPRWPSVVPSWDNSARATRSSLALVGANPQVFEEWMYEALARSTGRGDSDLIFVNAWNEWAEGAHLEPDARHGSAWLRAHASALRRIGDRAW